MMESVSSVPLVSMVCDTYNQAPFIGKTLEGFLMQKTTFPVEIVVHDDASTDGTAEIVSRYEKEHPDLFRCIYRSENMYRHDPKILEHYVFPYCRGKYIAICEGDDYWTDPLKIQKQAEWMESHPDCTLCFTACDLIDADGNIIGAETPFGSDCDVPTETIIRGMGGFCPTASIMAPGDLCRNRPAYCDLVEVDDAPLQIFFASRGSVHYLSARTCAYRVSAPGSWTEMQRREKTEKRVLLQEHMIRMHEAFDEETGGRWHDAVQDAIRKDRFEIAWYQRDRKTMILPEYRDLYRSLPLSTRIKLFIRQLLAAGK